MASDVVGLPCEVVKTRSVAEREESGDSLRYLLGCPGGWRNLYQGWQARGVEAALQGGFFLVGAEAGKAAFKGAPSLVRALGTGAAGGLAQSVIMTPTTLLVTAAVRGEGSAFETAKKIYGEEGALGFTRGGAALTLRQISNWSTRAFFTKLADQTLPRYITGTARGLASGVVGGVGGCWNTPLEVARVNNQARLGDKNAIGTMVDIARQDGPQELYRGVLPRMLQSSTQTIFQIVIPTLMAGGGRR